MERPLDEPIINSLKPPVSSRLILLPDACADAFFICTAVSYFLIDQHFYGLSFGLPWIFYSEFVLSSCLGLIYEFDRRALIYDIALICFVVTVVRTIIVLKTSNR